jgi:hypothetical protein
MDDFNAEEFARRLQLGEFDSRLYEVLEDLTIDQLEEVALLLKPSTSRPTLAVTPAGESHNLLTFAASVRLKRS